MEGKAMNMLVMGGDARSAYLAQMAAANGWKVQARYMEQFVELLPNDGLTADAWDVVVLPYPICEKDGMLWTPLSAQRVQLCETMQEMNQARCVVGGKGAAQWRKDVINPGDDEGFVMENAEITAEGAAFCAMRDGKSGIRRSCCLILGCGRIARFLAHKLNRLGAEVIVAARRERDRAYAEASGWQAASFETEDFCAALARADFVFNTVPYPVLDGEKLRRIRQSAVLYELASPPYGFSMEEARRLGVSAQMESGLPGKYAPQAAASALYHVIKRRMKEAENHA